MDMSNHGKSIPDAEKSRLTATSTVSGNRDQLKKKILIIEDDELVLNIYRNKLVVDDYVVEISTAGESGLEKLETFRPDLVVLDLMLPKMSGVDVIREIRAKPEFSHLPIVVISNTYSTKSIEDAWKAGATKCVSKIDCRPSSVVDLVRSTLGGN